MILVADENVERQIVDRLRRDGHDVLEVAATLAGLDDTGVLTVAVERSAILLTHDRDFGELVFRRGLTHAGVILVRLDGLSNIEKAETVSREVAAHAAELIGAFTVINIHQTRIRGKE